MFKLIPQKNYFEIFTQFPRKNTFIVHTRYNIEYKNGQNENNFRAIKVSYTIIRIHKLELNFKMCIYLLFKRFSDKMFINLPH